MSNDLNILKPIVLEIDQVKTSDYFIKMGKVQVMDYIVKNYQTNFKNMIVFRGIDYSEDMAGINLLDHWRIKDEYKYFKFELYREAVKYITDRPDLPPRLVKPEALDDKIRVFNEFKNITTNNNIRCLLLDWKIDLYTNSFTLLHSLGDHELFFTLYEPLLTLAKKEIESEEEFVFPEVIEHHASMEKVYVDRHVLCLYEIAVEYRLIEKPIDVEGFSFLSEEYLSIAGRISHFYQFCDSNQIYNSNALTRDHIEYITKIFKYRVYIDETVEGLAHKLLELRPTIKMYRKSMDLSKKCRFLLIPGYKEFFDKYLEMKVKEGSLIEEAKERAIRTLRDIYKKEKEIAETSRNSSISNINEKCDRIFEEVEKLTSTAINNLTRRLK